MNVEVQKYRKLTGGALKGTFTLVIRDWGNLEINQCKHFASTLSSEWFKFPDEKGKLDAQGKQQYYRMITLGDKDVERNLQEAVIKAIANYKHEVPYVSSKASAFSEDSLQSDAGDLW